MRGKCDTQPSENSMMTRLEKFLLSDNSFLAYEVSSTVHFLILFFYLGMKPAMYAKYDTYLIIKISSLLRICMMTSRFLVAHFRINEDNY